MQKKLSVRVFALLATLMMVTFSIPFISASAATTLYDNKVGTEGDYDYELWKDTGNTTMVLTGNGTFTCEWSNINNCLFREGKKYNPPVNYKTLGDVDIKYGVDYQPDGNSYMCVYGWSKSPLVEYYIVETWGSWRPPGNEAQKMGEVTVNNSTYDIYKTQRIDKPSIEGDHSTFDQYWSVRKSKPAAKGTKIEGVISVSEHFKAWEKAGLPELGNLTEIALNIEGYQSRGKADVYENILKIGGKIEEEPVTPIEPDENGYYTNDGFEDNSGAWTARGSVKTALTSSQSHGGSKSMSISGRTDAWNGAQMDLDPVTYKPGESYSFSTYMMQDKADSDSFKLSLQYDLDGKTNYTQIAKAEGAKGKWVQLANTSFTIPEGASSVILYAETDDSTNDFYLDDAIIAKKGVSITGDPEDTPSDEKTAGDVDGNGVVNGADAKALMSFLSKQKADIVLENADVDGNGSINIFDLVYLKKLLSKASTLPSAAKTDPMFSSTFESGKDGWTSRGNTTLALNSSNYYSGSSSLKVTGRAESWQGAAYELDAKEFVPGNSYSFSTAVMQNSPSAVEMKLTLQYKDASGEANYSTVAKADAESCKWTKLENTSYKIPAGASELILYVESTESTTDYYIDNAVGAASGTASEVKTGGGKVSDTPKAAAAADGSVDISWIDKSKPMMAIAFDDGPDPNHNYAGRILDAISDQGFHATFFYIGNNINSPAAQNELKKADSLGMEIANHSMTHTNLTTLSAAQIRDEYDKCSDKVKSVIGRGTAKVMRPPYLGVNDTVKQALSDIALVNCKLDTGDWSGSTKDQIIQKITSGMNDGSLRNAVILCHETYESTASAIEYLAPYMKQQGWQIVTVSEMFAANGKQLKTGEVNNYC